MMFVFQMMKEHAVKKKTENPLLNQKISLTLQANTGLLVGKRVDNWSEGSKRSDVVKYLEILKSLDTSLAAYSPKPSERAALAKVRLEVHRQIDALSLSLTREIVGTYVAPLSKNENGSFSLQLDNGHMSVDFAFSKGVPAVKGVK